MDLFFSFRVTGDRSAIPGPECGVCVQSEQSTRSPVCPSVWVDERGFIVLPQKEVGSRTGQRVTGRSERPEQGGKQSGQQQVLGLGSCCCTVTCAIKAFWFRWLVIMTKKSLGSSCSEYRATSLLGLLYAEGLCGFLWNLGCQSEG